MRCMFRHTLMEAFDPTPDGYPCTHIMQLESEPGTAHLPCSIQDVALEAGHQGAVEALLPPEDKPPTPPGSNAGTGPRTPEASRAVTPSGVLGLRTGCPVSGLAGGAATVCAGGMSQAVGAMGLQALGFSTNVTAQQAGGCICS